MKNLEVKIKKLHPDAVIPSYAKLGDAGLDLTAVEITHPRIEACGPYVEIDTGLAFEIPEGYVGLVFPRSSIVPKTSYVLGNSVGVIDSQYRGSIKFRFRDLNNLYGRAVYNVGDRIGQIVILPYPEINLVEVEELSETDRGEGGFGSSGE